MSRSLREFDRELFLYPLLQKIPRNGSVASERMDPEVNQKESFLGAVWGCIAVMNRPGFPFSLRYILSGMGNRFRSTVQVYPVFIMMLSKRCAYFIRGLHLTISLKSGFLF